MESSGRMKYIAIRLTDKTWGIAKQVVGNEEAYTLISKGMYENTAKHIVKTLSEFDK